MRLETGIVQEGNDWPGVFIRGDHALSYTHSIRRALKELDKVGGDKTLFMAMAKLRELANLFESCNVQKSPKTQHVKLV